MKAAVYDTPGPPSVLKYRDVPDPTCGPDDVLIAVEAVSIEGGDLVNRRSTQQQTSWIVGYAASGTIVEIGGNVRDRNIGDKVTAFDLQGSHAELWSVRASRTWRVPDGLDMVKAAALPISLGTAYHCIITKGALKKNEYLLVQGAAGGVGLAAVQLARRARAKVIAVTSGRERSTRLTAIGADHVIDRLQHDIAEETLRITGGKGVDVAIDPVGSTLKTSLTSLAPDGRLVFVGNAGGNGLEVDLWPAMQNNQALFGVFMGPLFERAEVYQNVNQLLMSASRGEVDVLIDRVFRLSEASEAHDYAENAKPFGRVVMKP